MERLSCTVEVGEKELYEMEFPSTPGCIRFIYCFYGTEKKKLKPQHFVVQTFFNSGTQI
jgi:hypothetical protein